VRNNMPAFIDSKNLQPFVNDDLKALLEPVDFLDGARKMK